MALDQKLRAKSGLETKLVSLRDSASGNNTFDISISSDSDVLKFTGDQGTTFSIGDIRRGVVEVAGDSSNIFSVKNQSGVHYFDVDSSKAVRIGATDSDVTLLLGTDSADSRYKLQVSGTIKSDFLKGDGSQLTNLPSNTITYNNVDSDFTATAGIFYLADTTNGTFTATLPASPSQGDFVVISDGADFSTNNITVARNGSTIEDSAGDVILDVQQTENRFVYNGSTWHIFVTAGINSETPYSTTDFDSDFGTKTTTNLPEGSNLYYTKARVDSDILAKVDSSYVGNKLSAGTGVTFVNNTFSIGQAVGTGDSVSFSGLHVDSSGKFVTPSVFITGYENALTLNTGVDSSTAPNTDVSIRIRRGNAQGVSIKWAEDSDKWYLQNASGTYNEILTREHEGSSPAAGGIDADKLESQEGTYYLNYNNFSNKPTSITDFDVVDGNSGQFLRTDGAGNFSFVSITQGGNTTGYSGYETYNYATSTPTTVFATDSAQYTRVQVFRNGVLLNANLYSFDSTSGRATLTDATDSGDIVTLWAFSSTGLVNHQLITVDSANAGGHATFTGNITSGGYVATNSFIIPDSAGTSGQVLKWPSSGTTLIWANDSAPPSGIDSAATVSIITTTVDSAYVTARAGGVDSAATVSLITTTVDSAYVSARGGAQKDVFWENSQLLSVSHTISSGRSALSAGPITIDSAATVTIDSGSRWVIL